MNSSNGHGGARPGAGRPTGAVSKLSKEAREKALNDGDGRLPHEILLDMARGNPQPVKTANMDEQTGEVTVKVIRYEMPDLEQRRDAAKAAAPYYAPKISTIEVTSGVNDDELDRIIAGLATEAGVSLGTGGEGETGEAEAASTRKQRRRVE